MPNCGSLLRCIVKLRSSPAPQCAITRPTVYVVLGSGGPPRWRNTEADRTDQRQLLLPARMVDVYHHTVAQIAETGNMGSDPENRESVPDFQDSFFHASFKRDSAWPSASSQRSRCWGLARSERRLSPGRPGEPILTSNSASGSGETHPSPW